MLSGQPRHSERGRVCMFDWRQLGMGGYRGVSIIISQQALTAYSHLYHWRGELHCVGSAFHSCEYCYSSNEIIHPLFVYSLICLGFECFFSHGSAQKHENVMKCAGVPEVQISLQALKHTYSTSLHLSTTLTRFYTNSFFNSTPYQLLE